MGENYLILGHFPENLGKNTILFDFDVFHLQSDSKNEKNKYKEKQTMYFK